MGQETEIGLHVLYTQSLYPSQGGLRDNLGLAATANRGCCRGGRGGHAHYIGADVDTELVDDRGRTTTASRRHDLNLVVSRPEARPECSDWSNRHDFISAGRSNPSRRINAGGARKCAAKQTQG